MFRRVILESWHDYIPYIGFALIAGVFVIIVVYALLMPKSRVRHLASMPLRDGKELLAEQAESESNKESR